MLQENNDMEELLRRAAENYPLKTDNADWEKMRTRLAAENFSDAPASNKKNGGLWLLLLLLPLAWAGYFYIPFTGTGNNKNSLKEEISKNDKAALQVIKQNISGESVKNYQPNLNEPAASNSVTPALVQKNKFSAKTRSVTKFTLSTSDQSSVENTPQHLLNSPNDKTNTTTSQDTETNTTHNIEKNINNKQVEKSSKEQTVVTTDDVKNNDQTLKKESKSKKKKNKFLYIGAIGGPDMSVVKFQSIKKTGTNAGVILGYQLSKKLSFETGVVWNKKYYYSNGSYFKTNKIYLPPAAKITNVDGNCKMIEIPLNVKYNFKSKGKANLFSTLGVSSYFMEEETYDYTVVSTGQPYPYKKTYKQSSQFFLSAINIGAGYNHILGKLGVLRVEPYVKIPLKGIGIGSLPITSVGINIGVTKKLF